ncbi:MAG: histidine--tRNA ligase [Ignavibacteria bacterium]|jgi:histidyl-tRNA synthetase
MRGIVPRKIKGFRDIDSQANHLRWKIINAASKVYKRYGFEHWDTPAIEYADNIGKFMPDSDTVEQGVYSFRNPEIEPVYKSDGSELRDENENVVMENHFLALRYDLTAPLARKYSEDLWVNYLKGQVTTKSAPLFRRYQFGPVFRYEAKLDPGRFREFWQIDFDSVGSKEMTSDAEACMVLSEALEEIGLARGSYIVKVNNRKLLKGFLKGLGVETEELEQNILRIIDKKDKIGLDGLKDELGKGREDSSGAVIPGLGLDNSLVDGILNLYEKFAETEARKSILSKLESLVKENEFTEQGLKELYEIDEILEKLNYNEERVIFDPTLIRGMAYYTGPVYEVESTQTFKDRKGRERKVGSICGGGRYDDLVKRLLGLEVPATGASIGVDRLAELLTLTDQSDSIAEGPVLVIVFNDNLMGDYQQIARSLRENDISAEVFYGANKNLKKQLSYADKKNCPVAILLGEDEFKKGVVTVRNLRLGKEMADKIEDKSEWKNKVQTEVPREELVNKVKNLLAS